MNAPARSLNGLSANQQALSRALAALRARLQGDSSARPDVTGVPTLARIAEAFGLSRFEAEILLLCAARELDASAPSLFASAPFADAAPYPTFGLALSIFEAAHWSALGPWGPLRRWFLVEFDPADGLVGGRLRIAESVLHAIVGGDELDERLGGLLRPVEAPDLLAVDLSSAMAGLAAQWTKRRGRDGALAPIELVGEDPAELEVAAAHLCALSDLRLFAIAASELPQSPDALSPLLRRIQRELVLRDGCLMVAADKDIEKIGLVADVVDRGPIVTARAPLRGWSRRRPRTVMAPRVAGPDRARLWSQAVGGLSLPADTLERAMGQFHLSPSALRSVARRLSDEACESDDDAVRARALWRACQTEASAAISDLAATIAPSADWGDLILPAPQMALLRALAAQSRHRSKVYDEWGFAEKSARGLGAAALFAGPSGTGKTLAAEVIASSLDLALWRIDLSQVVSKWIGETEKNLARVFEAADPGGAVLLFDEADALFGKRSEVKDSHDRYANLEISFLLQRMETYRGLAILTTNNEDALDKAFVRRLRTIVQFPFPDARLREGIWRRIFPPQTPTAGLRFDKLARLQLSGGAIRNVALTSAFLAAESGEAVGMGQLREAAQIECAKMKRPLSPAEFEDWTTP